MKLLEVPSPNKSARLSNEQIDFQMNKSKSNWWAFAWVLIPISVGIVVSLILAGFSPITPNEKLTRLVGFLVGWAIGFSLQLAALRCRFDDVLEVVGGSLRLFHVLLSEGVIFALLRKIVSLSERFEKDTDHLPSAIKERVLNWIEVFLDEAETASSKFADNKTYFHSDKGMEIDHDLVRSATCNIRASTHVTADSVEFWTKKRQGRKYRESCIEKAQQFGTVKFGPTNDLKSGVARLFSFEIPIIAAAERKDSNAMTLIESAIGEALLQQSSGIEVRILHQADVQDKEVALLDVLVVDGAISSTTEKLESGGVGRRIAVSWQRTEVNSIGRDWDLLWGRGSTIADFCTEHGFTLHKQKE